CAMTIKGVSLPVYDAGQATAIAGGLALACGLCAAGQVLQSGGGRLKALRWSGVAAVVGGIVAAALWWAIAGHVLRPLPVGAGILVGIFVGAIVGLING